MYVKLKNTYLRNKIAISISSLLSQNNFTSIKAGVFSKLHQLLWLFLDGSYIESIFLEDFRDLSSLEWL